MGSNSFVPSLPSVLQLTLPKSLCNYDDCKNGMINNEKD